MGTGLQVSRYVAPRRRTSDEVPDILRVAEVQRGSCLGYADLFSNLRSRYPTEVWRLHYPGPDLLDRLPQLGDDVGLPVEYEEAVRRQSPI